MGNAIAFLSSWFVKPRKDEEEQCKADSTSTNQEQTTYSWDRREKSDNKSFYIKEIAGRNYCHSLLESNREQCLYIQNCSSSVILATDISDSVFIDDCSNCKIVLGPVKRSVFVRNCNGSLIACICGQFRTRDCTDLTCFLNCISQPTIEASSAIRFNVISISYKNLNDQLTKTEHRHSENQWFNIFDFTPNIGPAGTNLNWELLGADERIEKFLSRQEQEYCQEIGISFSSSESAIPANVPSLKRSGRRDQLT